MRAGVAAACKPFKNPFQLLRRDADTAIGDSDPDLSASACYIDFHLAFGIRIADSVIQEDHEKLPEPCRIAMHKLVCRPIGIGNFHRLRMGDDLGIAAYLLKQIAEIDGLQIEASGASTLTGYE